jgi:thiamine biosynthesis lipoprotein
MNRVLVPQISAQPLSPRHTLPLELSGETMGTTWRLRAFAPPNFDALRLEADLHELFDDVIEQMSPWATGSLINRFNNLPAGECSTLGQLAGSAAASRRRIA